MTIAIKSLSDGQLANSKGTIYTAPTTTQAIVKNIKLVNTNTTSENCNLYFKASGGTSRRIIVQDVPIAAKGMLIMNTEITLEAADILEGDAQTASKVDYVVSGVENS